MQAGRAGPAAPGPGRRPARFPPSPQRWPRFLHPRRPEDARFRAVEWPNGDSGAGTGEEAGPLPSLPPGRPGGGPGEPPPDPGPRSPCRASCSGAARLHAAGAPVHRALPHAAGPGAGAGPAGAGALPAMAPKKPPPPPPPPPAPAPGEEEIIHVPKFKAIPPEVKWRVIRLFGIFCFGVFIYSTIEYIKLIQLPPSPYIEPMKTVRRTMSNALRKPAVNKISDLGTADEVMQLPNYMEETEKAYMERKNKYQSIYKKGTVKATTHWTLFGKSLYYISVGRKTWYDAQNFCLSRDSRMVSILNDEEQKFVSLQLNESAWIGLTDENEEGIWQWSDGSRLTIQFWDIGSPTVTKKHGEVERDCAFINPSSAAFNWKDDNCHELKQWVCKEIIVMEDLEYISKP